MDNDEQFKQAADDSSLESNETVIVQRPNAASPEIQTTTVDNSTFVGYQPPKPPAWQRFLSVHKVKLLVGCITVLVVSISGSMYVASSRAKEVNLAAPAAQPVDPIVAKVSPKVEAETTKPDSFSAAYSLQSGQKMYKLVSDGEIWLERSESEWLHYATSEGWLYFLARATAAGSTDAATTSKVSLAAFNFKTKEYVSLGDMQPPPQATFASAMKVEAGYVYIPFTAAGSSGTLYRCKIDAQKACTDLELFYDQPGGLQILNDAEAYVLDSTTQGELYTYSLKRLDLRSKQSADIRSGSMTKGVGEYVAAFSDAGLVWIVTTRQSDVEGDAASAVIEKLTAYDISGAQKFLVTPDAFPLSNPSFSFSDTVGSQQILFTNAQQQVMFDANTKEFGAVTKKTTQNTTISDFLDRAEEALHLPSLFSIKEIL